MGEVDPLIPSEMHAITLLGFISKPLKRLCPNTVEKACACLSCCNLLSSGTNLDTPIRTQLGSKVLKKF